MGSRFFKPPILALLVTGCLIPPATGAGKFYLRSDDASQPWLSTDDNTSPEAALTVTADPLAPTILGVTGSATFTEVTVKYSEPVSAATAGAAANYALDGGLTVSAVSVVDDSTVKLTTSKQAEGQVYNLTVNNVADTATPPNPIAANTKQVFKSFVFTPGVALHRFWDNILQNDIEELTNNARFPDSPTFVTLEPLYEYGPNGSNEAGSNYGNQLIALITPPTSGDYVFYCSGDDPVNLFLSTDDNPANKKLICIEPAWNNAREWQTPGSNGTGRNLDAPENRSDTYADTQWLGGNTITLIAGQRYYLEALHAEGGAGDSVGATWKLPGDAEPATGSPPIGGQHMGVYLDPNGASLSITQQPTDTTIDEGFTATLSVAATGTSAYGTNVIFQWQVAIKGSTDFANLLGATQPSFTTPVLIQADSGVQYRVLLSVPTINTTSSVATVTVRADASPPTFASAGTYGNPNKVVVVFSEPVSSQLSAANFVIDNGVAVTAVAAGAGTDTIELTTSAITLGKTYTLTANGVKDLAGNAILADSKFPINLAVEAPTEVGTTVNGFQDDFESATRDPLWVAAPAEKDEYLPANGVLKVTVVGDNPGQDTHLLYTAPGYDDAVQEVLARIRIINFGKGDPARCGIAVAVNPDDSQGINLHFRDNDQDNVLGRQFKLLDDRRAWGPAGYKIEGGWKNNTWYWLRLRQNGSEGADNITGKVWLADGTTPEPANWQLNWQRDGRIGFAGLVASSIGGLSEYEVDYILIKAAGLPNIQVEPKAFSLRPEPPPDGHTINIARLGNDIILTWAGAGTLEAADAVTGAWAAVTGATSPRTVTISGVAKFYRIRL